MDGTTTDTYIRVLASLRTELQGKRLMLWGAMDDEHMVPGAKIELHEAETLLAQVCGKLNKIIVDLGGKP